MAKFRIKELAQKQGMTAEELAFKSGVKFSTVRNLWQNRVTDPNYSTLAGVAKALGVQIEALLDEGDRTDVQSGGLAMPMPAAA